MLHTLSWGQQGFISALSPLKMPRLVSSKLETEARLVSIGARAITGTQPCKLKRNPFSVQK